MGVALLGRSLFWLHHLLGKYHWRDILAHVHAIPNRKVLRAAFFTCAGYGCLTCTMRSPCASPARVSPYPRVALISFMGYAIGHNVGLNTFSGGAVRYRAYTALGLSAKQIATIIAFGTFTFFLGAGLLLGLSLLSNAGMSGSVLHVHAWLARARRRPAAGGRRAYFWLVCTRHAPLRFRNVSKFRCRKPRIAFAQIGIAAPICCAPPACCTCYCRAQASICFAAFAGVYLLALAAGAVSNVPGGIGVFEFVLLLLLPEVPRTGCSARWSRIAPSTTLRRSPWRWCLLGVHEVWVHRAPVVRLVRLVRTFLTAVTPQAIAIAVFVAGAVLLFSGATPGLGNRLALLRGFVPLPVLELSHLLGSVVGVGLAGHRPRPVSTLAHRMVADDLAVVRRHTAVAAQGLRLRRSLDVGSGGGHAGLGARALSAPRFLDRPAIFHARGSWPFFWCCCTAGWLVLFAYRHLPYDNELWWQFAFHASAPRSLRAIAADGGDRARLTACGACCGRRRRGFRRRRRRIWSALRC